MNICQSAEETIHTLYVFLCNKQGIANKIKVRQKYISLSLKFSDKLFLT